MEDADQQQTKTEQQQQSDQQPAERVGEPATAGNIGQQRSQERGSLLLQKFLVHPDPRSVKSQKLTRCKMTFPILWTSWWSNSSKCRQHWLSWKEIEPERRTSAGQRLQGKTDCWICWEASSLTCTCCEHHLQLALVVVFLRNQRRKRQFRYKIATSQL